MKNHIGILVFDGVDELDFASVFEVLKKASAVDDSICPLLIGKKSTILGSNHLCFNCDVDYTHIDKCVALVIPGGPGIHALKVDNDLKERIGLFVEKLYPIYTVCSGIFLLAYFGFTKQRTIAAHHLKKQALLDICDCHILSGVVRDKNIISVGGDMQNFGVKGIQIGYEIVKDFSPKVLSHIVERLEIRANFS